jgi:hypothetical protein
MELKRRILAETKPIAWDVRHDQRAGGYASTDPDVGVPYAMMIAYAAAYPCQTEFK